MIKNLLPFGIKKKDSKIPVSPPDEFIRFGEIRNTIKAKKLRTQ